MNKNITATVAQIPRYSRFQLGCANHAEIPEMMKKTHSNWTPECQTIAILNLDA